VGVYYRAVSGFGIMLSDEDDDIKQIAAHMGFENEYDPEDFDSGEFAEWLCRRYEVHYSFAGNAYDGDTYILIGDVHSSDIYGLEETAMPQAFSQDSDLVQRLETIVADMGVDKKIAFYAGIYIY
jgi:hypothetical protein